MEKKSFVQGAAILAVAGLIVKFIGAVYRVPLGNALGVQGMEYYEVVYPFYSALLVISSAGLPTAISKLVSERLTLGDQRGAKNVFRIALRVLFGIGIVTTLLMYIGSNALAGMTVLPDASLSFKALSPALFFVSVMCAYRGYLQGMQMMTGTAISQVVEQVGKLVIGLTLANLWMPQGPQYAAMGALIGVAVSELLALIVVALFYLRQRKKFQVRISSNPQTPTSKVLLRSLFSVAIPVTIGASIMPLTGIVDVSLIKSTLMDLGFTEAAAGGAFTMLRSYVTPLINMPAVLTMALAMSLVPAISSRMVEKDYKGIRSALRTSMKLAMLIGTPCAIGLFVLGKPIIGMLFSVLNETELTLAAELMCTASIGVIFLSLVQTLTGALQGLGKPNVPVVNLIFGGILKVITMLTLMRIPHINIQGAAVSTVICYAAAAILDAVYIVRKTSLRLNLWDVFGKPIFASLIMGGAIYFLFPLLSSRVSETLATLATVGAAVVIYVILAIVLRMLNEDDLTFMPGGKRLKRLLKRSK